LAEGLVNYCNISGTHHIARPSEAPTLHSNC
jgi:hypothetical protein